MHPFHHVYLHRGPSRIFWFLMGAGFATFWHHSRDMYDHRAQYFPCVMRPRRIEAPNAGEPSNYSNYSPRPSDPTAPQDGRWVWKAGWGPEREADRTVGWNQREWEEDKERLRNLQKRAAEAAVDFSESTLDSIVAAAESLKTRLAERRAQRDQQMQQFSQQLHTEKKDTPQSA